MAVKIKEMVIDADIAHSAGESDHPISSNCRNFLEAVKENGHQLVMTKEIRDEWNRHRSVYSTRWSVLMVSRKQVKMIRIDENKKTESDLPNWGLTDKQKKIALKDCRLIDAALQSGKIVASGDKKARDVFSIASEKEKKLRTLIWVNPKEGKTELTNWIKGLENQQKEWFLYN